MRTGRFAVGQLAIAEGHSVRRMIRHDAPAGCSEGMVAAAPACPGMGRATPVAVAARASQPASRRS